MEDWLIDKTKEDLLVFCQPGPKWEDSTMNKHSWALHIYSPFCKILEVPQFPLSEHNIIPFIRFLGTAVRYKITSLKVC